jgi:VanZ family protein
MIITRPMVATAAAATTAALVLLEMPSSYVPAPAFANQDKVEHIALFAMLAVLWRAAGLRPRTVLDAAVVLAVGSEALQGWLGLGRTADVYDALADLVGAILGLAAWAGLTVVRPRRA